MIYFQHFAVQVVFLNIFKTTKVINPMTDITPWIDAIMAMSTCPHPLLSPKNMKVQTMLDPR